jgi:hypothetical protein
MHNAVQQQQQQQNEMHTPMKTTMRIPTQAFISVDE